ncbi:MAG TPA: valine--tRNA ligase [Flavitalea sp.]|nr:valine--tRNA ligase [Flavitalea sp.]
MDLSKNYNPATVEDKWYKHWKESKYFHSEPDARPAYSIVIPPPNVTGVLHMGHTLNETVQDILIRKARMSGFNACWVPGSDHASIATEAKVVQMLQEKGIKKSDLSREEFLRYAFEWKEKYGNIIYHQIEKLGCSVDWERVSFTMDPDYYKAVMKVFVDLYKKEKLYRGARMIHWDPAAKTALSDEEVDYRDIQGKLYYVKYLVADDSPTGNPHAPVSAPRYITVATQRPETIMGDTAVCVNPNDTRYAALAGKYVIVPLVNRKVPVIFDEYVDPGFGTGALKITPAHDINDYNIGLKHNLEVIDTLNEDGTMSVAAQVYVGLDRFEARKLSIEQLRQDDLLVKEEDYTTRLGFSQRSGAVVEPRISTQWFVKMKELAGPALAEVIEGRINIHPGDKFLATYKYWMENVRDWCISRQLWWGQQIPAWYDENGTCYVAETLDQLLTEHPELANSKLKQDEDVMDTWFSSWLWPIQVFKGITKPGNPEINYYYPTAVLVTGQDIIFFWVSRMIMAGMEYKQEKPFGDVYFTGMVRDKLGRKMSKSLGNSPDLLDLITRFGADAVRFGIMISSPAGNDLLFDDSSCEQGRNFNNKLWNALKLVKNWEARIGTEEPGMEHFAVDWFRSRLSQVKGELETLYKDFRLSEALKTIYSLIWDDFCSWYLEWVKPGFEQPVNPAIYNNTVGFFTELMQILHPFMPFITQEIYHLLDDRQEDLMVTRFDAIAPYDGSILKQGLLLKDVITSLRDVRVKNNIKPKEPIKVYIVSAETAAYSKIQDILVKQVNINGISHVSEAVHNTISLVVGTDKFFIETETEIDNTAQLVTLKKELEYLKGFLVSIDKKLGNEKFVANAKADVLALEQKKKADAEAKIKVIEESLR